MKFSLDKKSWWLLILGLLYPVTFRIWGIVRLGEIVAILLGFWAMMKYGRSYMKIKSFSILILLYCLCLFAIPVSDWLNHTAAIDAIKGFGTFAFLFPFFFVSMWLLSDDVSRIKYFVLANVVAQWIVVMFFPSLSYEASMYLESATSIEEKLNLENELFAYQYAPIVLALLCVTYGKHQRLVSFLLLPVGLFFLFGGSRNLFLIYGVSAIILLIIGKVDESNKFRKLLYLKKNIFLIVVFIGIAALCVKNIYASLAEAGYLGEKAQYKYEVQSKSGNLFKGGRSEFFIGLYAISKDPVWGYGSFAKDKYGICEEYARINDEYNYRTKNDLIPAHSYILQYWLWYGLPAVPFWIYIIYLFVYSFFRSCCYKPEMTAYFVVSIAAMLYHIFFSPFQNRLNFSLLVICVLLMNYYTKKETAIKRFAV